MQPPALRNRESRCSCPAEKRIVLVGASVRAAAQSAARAGFCVTGIDLFGDRDTQTACHQHFVIPNSCGADDLQGDAGTSHQVDLERTIQACEGVPAVTVGGLKAGNLLSKRLADLCPLLKPALDVGEQLENVGFLRGLAAAAGLRFPRTLDQCSQQTEMPLDGRWLIKQRGSCGGVGVRWHHVEHKTAADEFLQQWVAGRSYGATMLASGDDVVLLGVCRSLFSRRSRLPFVYAGSFGPVAVSSETAGTLTRLGQRIVATTSLRGLFNVDYLLDRRGDAWLLEINPRWSGSSELVERRLIDRHALGAKNSLFELSIQAITGRKVLLWDCSEITSAAHSPAGESSLSEERGEPSPAVQTSDPPASGRVNQSTNNEVISQQFHSALRKLSVGVLSDKNATPVSRTMLTSRQDPVSAEDHPLYLKRIMYARSDIRFHSGVISQLTGLASRHQAAIHDIPCDGTLIRQAEPMFTLISKIEPHEKNPMRKHRVLQRVMHAAVERNRASRYSPRSSA